MPGQPIRGINGTSVNADTTMAMLNIAGESAGMKKRPSAFSMPVTDTGERDHREEGQRNARQQRRQLELAWDERVAGREPAGEMRRQEPSGDDARERHHDERVDGEVAEPPRLVAAALPPDGG